MAKGSGRTARGQQGVEDPGGSHPTPRPCRFLFRAAVAHWGNYRVTGGIPGQEIVMGTVIHPRTSCVPPAVSNP